MFDFLFHCDSVVMVLAGFLEYVPHGYGDDRGSTGIRYWGEAQHARSRSRIGDAWVREARSAMIALPSVIISGEPNYLINPAHPDFKKISIGKPETFAFDSRLLT